MNIKTIQKINLNSHILEDIELEYDKIRERLKEVRLARGLSKVKFYEPLGEKTVSNWTGIENGRRAFGKRSLNDVISLYNINSDWLLYGQGDMFVQTNGVTSGDKVEFGVPFFNVNLSEITFSETGMFREPPEYYVNFRPFNDCDAFLPIYGDSMYPKYASGEIIAIREITNFDIIQWGEAYLVVADETANNITTVKLIFEHPDPQKIVLRSSNPNFKGDTVLSKNVLQRMFLVKGKVTRNQL